MALSPHETLLYRAQLWSRATEEGKLINDLAEYVTELEAEIDRLKGFESYVEERCSMTRAKEIARAFVEMILSEDIEYMDIAEFAHDYDNGETDVNYETVYDSILEYMVEIRENFKNGK